MKLPVYSMLLVLFTDFACAQDLPDQALATFVQSLSILTDPAQRLDSRLLESTLNVALQKNCRGPVPDQGGDYYVCTYTAAAPQRQLFQLDRFETAARHRDPDLGGTVTWTVDAATACLTRDALANAFHRTPSFPRFPEYQEIRPSNPAPSVTNAYDLVLQAFQPAKENTFIAIYEEKKCAVKIKLYKNE